MVTSISGYFTTILLVSEPIQAVKIGEDVLLREKLESPQSPSL
jgi:hypothetical protein